MEGSTTFTFKKFHDEFGFAVNGRDSELRGLSSNLEIREEQLRLASEFERCVGKKNKLNISDDEVKAIDDELEKIWNRLEVLKRK